MILLPQKVAYRGTLTGLRISAVDGTAFLDNCAALVPYADGSHLVEIYDASGRMLRGYLSAAGDGETLGDELVAGWTNLVANPFETFTANADGINIDEMTNSSGGGRAVSNAPVLTLGTLYKYTVDVTRLAGLPAVFVFALAANSEGGFFATNEYRSVVAGGNFAGYFTPFRDGATYVGFNTTSTTGASMRTTNWSYKPVTGPSSNGCTIVSAKGGATQNFAYKNASFTYNAASYYCLIKRAR